MPTPFLCILPEARTKAQLVANARWQIGQALAHKFLKQFKTGLSFHFLLPAWSCLVLPQTLLWCFCYRWAVDRLSRGFHDGFFPLHLRVYRLHLQKLTFIIRNKKSLIYIYIDIISVSDVKSKKCHRLCALRWKKNRPETNAAKEPMHQKTKFGQFGPSEPQTRFGQSARCQDTEMRRGKIGKERAAFWILYPSVSICVHLYPISLGAPEPVIWGDFPGLPTNHLATLLHYFAWFCIPFCMSSACLLHVLFCATPVFPQV